jgi:2-keto-4-pentenoate hydratase/2-oxohepta-3-ene-1,7-dioic acid hydratase in catechol pathway
MSITIPLPDGLRQPVQRIFCVGKNYRDHILEMDPTPQEGLLIFMKPTQSMVAAGAEVLLPRGRGAVHHELELVLAIGKGGRDISEESAEEHVAALTIGVDLTLRDLQTELRAKRWPWEPAKAFEQSALLGAFAPYRPGWLDEGVTMHLAVNGEARQRTQSTAMVTAPKAIIHALSAIWTLLPGDIVYTGTCSGVGPLVPGDQIDIAAAGIGRFSWSCS